jgi:hypothetical protein
MSKKVTARNREALEAERLNAPVNMNGEGEDQVIKDLLSDKFVNGTNEEAVDISIALRQLISGQSILLANQERQSEEISRIKSRMVKIDEDAERWETDRTKFLQEVEDRADRLRTVSPDKAIANGALQFENALVKAKAEQAVDKMQFKERLAHMPLETVISPGELITVMEAGQQVSKLFPEVISIKGFKWVFAPGVPKEVPKIVADALRDRRRSQRENAMRGEMMGQNLEQDKFNQRWAELNKEFNSPTQ